MMRSRQECAPFLTGDETATSRLLDQPRPNHIKFCPMDAVVQDALPLTWQQLVALLLCQPKLIRKLLHCLRHAGLAFGSEPKHR